MKTGNYTEPSPGWNVPSARLLLAGILLIALCAASCRSNQPMIRTTSVRYDSLQGTKKVVAWQETIPGSRVSLKVPMDSISKLPIGAWYTGKQGQASVMVGRDSSDNLLVESTCDSIQRRCYYLEEELIRIRNELQEKETQPPDTGPTGWQWFRIRTGQILSAVCCSILIGIPIKQHLKRKRLWQ